MDVRIANRSDVSDVMALESRYFRDNLDQMQRSDGYISILHSQSWFESAVDSEGLHVAVNASNDIVGFIAITDPPDPEAAKESSIM
ncbi:MAG: hypothetical protein WC054_14135, partial [Candidatus Nanopelagicales bacterium]